MFIRNADKNTVLADGCKVADSFFSRFLGLMGAKALKSGEGLLLTPCNSIHMLFMRFPIDAVFLDTANEVVYIMEGIRPWRISPIIRKARSVLELPAGAARAALTGVGDRLELVR